MHALRNEEIYGSIIEELEDPMWGNERTINERKYRIKNGILKIHEMRQPADYSYWRTIVPDDQGIKLELLREIHCVPYSGHPGFHTNFGGYTTTLLLGTYDPRGKTVRVGLPGVSGRKRQSSQTSEEITAIRNASTKVGSRSLRFCSGVASTSGNGHNLHGSG